MPSKPDLILCSDWFYKQYKQQLELSRMPFTKDQLDAAMRSSVDWYLQKPITKPSPIDITWKPGLLYRPGDTVAMTASAIKNRWVDKMMADMYRRTEKRLRNALLFGTDIPGKFWLDQYETKWDLSKEEPLTYKSALVTFDLGMPDGDTRVYWLARNGLNTLTGMKASGVIIDDPHNGAKAMSKVIMTREALLDAGITTDYHGNLVTDTDAGVKLVKGKSVPVPKKDYNTIGMRFLQGPNLAQVYTYRIRKGAKVHLGQELVVPGKVNGVIQKSVAVVVEIHSTPQDTGPYEYKFVIGKVSPL